MREVYTFKGYRCFPDMRICLKGDMAHHVTEITPLKKYKVIDE